MNNARTTAPARYEDEREAAQDIAERTIDKAETVGDAARKLREQTQAKVTVTLQGQQGMKAEQVAKILRAKAYALEKTAGEHGDVRMEKDLPPGVLGQNTVGGSQSSASVREQLVIETVEGVHEEGSVESMQSETAQRLQTVLIHEVEGHGQQVAPKTGGKEIALATGEEDLTVTGVLEGDTTIRTSLEKGEAASKPEDGEPEQDYQEGRRGINEARRLVGAETVEAHVLGDGDYGALQGKIWEARLEKGEDAAVIVEEAKKTGYEKQAAEALMQMAA